MSRSDPSFRIETPDLGGRRGRLSDWVTQRWVQHTGRRVRWSEAPWLQAPVGDVNVIGARFYERYAERHGLRLRKDEGVRGLLERFDELESPRCRVGTIAPAVAAFYQRTSEFDLDVWSEWCGAYRPFGGLLAAIFSRRLQQLNLPLSPLDSRLGVSSQVLALEGPDGQAPWRAWVRTNLSDGAVIYAGSYAITRVPCREGGCVKVAFPLPNGYALVVLWPESHPDGSLTLHSSGEGFGDAGFYFYVEREPGEGWARYVGSLIEHIHVFVDPRGTLRADHELRIWRTRFLRLHYRLGRAATR
ncbi:MAG TPA: hypothetical protein VFQ05_03120 [Candidatus Eisenbacteria bacterium]|nr:hypothetical protein [Candidatus Eisenbacteria bacterium]